MYHDVVDGDADRSGFPGRDAALYKVTSDAFEEHLRALCETTTPHPALTFDDGGVSAMQAAAMLERHGLAGHFFVTTNFIGTPGFLDAEQIRALHARGHVVGSHSCSHPLRMGHCSWAQLLDEWTRSRTALEGILGCEVRCASVPGGDFAPSVAEAAARAGLTDLFTSEPTATVRHAFGVQLHGRFTIQRWTTAETVRGLAAGDWLPRARQAVVWNAKKLTKQIGGAGYLRIRKLLIGHGNDVQWGDTTRAKG
ncbi:MAG TPA: polysaccharide deacetylase family protein [Vicinamibacterales bacterium]|nr:polysaccharide deacetylase family protein [Vicinamibacterales bacterium]